MADKKQVVLSDKFSYTDPNQINTKIPYSKVCEITQKNPAIQALLDRIAAQKAESSK